MAPPTLVPSRTILSRWQRQGLTQGQMAAQHEADTGIRVTRAAIAGAMVRYGLAGDKPRYYNTIPWRVEGRHLTAYQARMLRLLGRRLDGRELNIGEAQRLDSWLATLEREDDPDTKDGFLYIDSSLGDGGDIPIRTKRVHSGITEPAQ